MSQKDEGVSTELIGAYVTFKDIHKWFFCFMLFLNPAFLCAYLKKKI